MRRLVAAGMGSGRLSRAAAGSAVMATVLAGTIAGCSGAHKTAITVPASSVLTTDADGLATAAGTGTASDLAAAAAKMRADVLALQASGGLSSDRAAAVLAQVQLVVADAALVEATSPAPASSAPSSDTPAPSSGPAGGHGRNKDGKPPGKDK
jgi:hypothetical protein